jgi:predicted nucleic acid-binding protein
MMVVDTDVVSLIFKGDSRAEGYLHFLQPSYAFVSFMTEAELERWILQAKWGPDRISRFRSYMKRFTSIPSSRDLVLCWAQVMIEAQKRGRRIETADAWIAATALLYGADLLTNNPSDYSGVPGIRILSEA